MLFTHLTIVICYSHITTPLIHNQLLCRSKYTHIWAALYDGEGEVCLVDGSGEVWWEVWYDDEEKYGCQLDLEKRRGEILMPSPNSTQLNLDQTLPLSKYQKLIHLLFLFPILNPPMISNLPKGQHITVTPEYFKYHAMFECLNCKANHNVWMCQL